MKAGRALGGAAGGAIGGAVADPAEKRLQVAGARRAELIAAEEERRAALRALRSRRDA